MQKNDPSFNGVGFVNPALYHLAKDKENGVFKTDIKGHNCTLFNSDTLDLFDEETENYPWDKTLCFSEDDSKRLYQANEQYNTASGLGELNGEKLLENIKTLYED